MRICVVYDCLYPYTIGGGERWYRNLAEHLADAGHDVTYVTLRQWDRGERPDIEERVRVVTAGPRMALYTTSGRRRILPPLVFGLGVLWHLLRHGRRYDVVHACAFPYFSLLSAALLRPLRGYALEVDWFEVWSDSYWRDYLGGLGGRVGGRVQRLCARVPQRAFCFSELHAQRLREEGLHGSVTVLRGLYAEPPPGPVPAPGSRRVPEPPPGPASAPSSRREPTQAPKPTSEPVPTPTSEPRPTAATAPAAEPLVLFAGRLIAEKQAPLGVSAIALASARIDGLRGEFLGDGPEREALHAAIAEHGLQASVTAPGFADTATVEREMRRAMCVLLPSRREGYGLVVVEAAARGTPSVVVAGEDNAATELIEEGVNGAIAERSDPQAIAEAIVRIHAEGGALRERTASWFAQNASRLSLESSLRLVLEGYSDGPAGGASGADRSDSGLPGAGGSRSS